MLSLVRSRLGARCAGQAPKALRTWEASIRTKSTLVHANKPEMAALAHFSEIVSAMEQARGRADILEPYRDVIQPKDLFENEEHFGKAEFEKVVQEWIGRLSECREKILGDIKTVTAYPKDEEEEQKLVTAMHFMAVAERYRRFGKCFHLMDKRDEGAVETAALRRGLDVLFFGTLGQILEFQCRVYDCDGDGLLAEDEVAMMVRSMARDTQNTLRAGLERLLYTDKKQKKLLRTFDKVMGDQDADEKLPEKIRCIWHFSEKTEQGLMTYNNFLQGQRQEFPELARLGTTFVDNFYNKRYQHYEEQRIRRRRMGIGAVFITGTGLLDYVIKTL